MSIIGGYRHVGVAIN